MKKIGSKVINAAAVLVTVAAVLVGIYIMIEKLGLVDGLDFGAGAYYYADIPGFEKFVNGSHYDNQVPMWVLILLFLVWGKLMYHLWSWLDKKL